MKLKIGDKVQFDWKNNDPFEWKNKNHWAKVCIQIAQHVDLITRGYNALESWQHSRFTHTGTVIDIKGDTYIVAEALNGGYTFTPYKNDYMDRLINQEYVLVLRPKVKLKNVLKNATKMEGYSYDWKAIAGLAFTTIFRVIPIVRKAGVVMRYLHIPTAKTIICSEANSRLDFECSNGKLDMPKEFGVTHDRVMPVHYTISKQYRTL
jgi:hypothetical protein